MINIFFCKKDSKTAILFILIFSFSIIADNNNSWANDNTNSIAILIGNKDYDETKNVDYAIRDVQSMKAFLIQKLGYDKNNITVLKNATLGKMRAWFGGNVRKSKLWKKIIPGQSNVFVYYSGHGAPAEAGELSNPYLIPTDVDPEFAEDGYSLKRMQRSLETIQEKLGANRHVILMLDACFSGNSAAGTIVKNSAGGWKLQMPKAKIIRLSASSASQVANWDNQAKHGLFTSQFLQAVEGKADTGRFGNQDGKVSWSEMSKFIKYRVSYLSKNGRGRREQNPEISSSGSLEWNIPSGQLNLPSENNNKNNAPELTERESFNLAKSIGNIEAWDNFIARYPNGRFLIFAKIARKHIKDKIQKETQRQNNLDRREAELQKKLEEIRRRQEESNQRKADNNRRKPPSQKLASCSNSTYQAAKNEDTREAYEAFLSICSDGYWARMARIALKRKSQKKRKHYAVVTPPRPSKPRTTVPRVSSCSEKPTCVVRSYYNALGSNAHRAESLWYNLTSKTSRAIRSIRNSRIADISLQNSSNYSAIVNANASVKGHGNWEKWGVEVHLTNTSNGWKITKIRSQKGFFSTNRVQVSTNTGGGCSYNAAASVVRSYYNALGSNSRKAQNLWYRPSRKQRRAIKGVKGARLRNFSVLYSARNSATVNAETSVRGRGRWENWGVEIHLKNTSGGCKITKIRGR